MTKNQWTTSANIVKEIIKKYELDNQDNYALFTIWEKELGKLSKKAKLLGKKGKLLIIEVDNPTYRQELMLRKNEFINKINQHFGKEFINNFKIET